MIVFKDVAFRYGGSEADDGLRQVNLEIPRGQVVLLCGESGCGKTTLTRLINGLIPHYCEGELAGSVTIGGQDILTQPVQQTAKKVGSVFQNPRSQFFTVDTTSELAFGCENMRWPAEKIEDRVRSIAGEFRLNHLLDRNLFRLSGGEKQKIACASVAAPDPEVIVLDEPSSNLDISSIKDLSGFIAAWKRMGKTIVITEHRLRYVLPLADRVIYMRDGEIALDLTAAEFMMLRAEKVSGMGLRPIVPIQFSQAAPHAEASIEMQNVQCFRDKKRSLFIESLSIPFGSTVAVLGDNGAGKTTFARCFCGLEKGAKGRFYSAGNELNARRRRSECFIVMQDVGHQLFTESVLDELRISFPKTCSEQVIADQTQEILESLHLAEIKQRHPQSLSGGEKQRVAIACAIASGKHILFYDEPTSGLDLRHMEEVSANIKRLQALGTTQFVITHDSELVARCCDYALFLKDGMVEWGSPLHPKCIGQLNKYFFS